MRPQRKYNPHEQFYALTSFKYAGVEYKRGDKFDIGEMPARSRVQFFQNWYIGYSSDFRDNKASIKEVEIQKPVEEEKPKEEVSDSPVEEKPKPQKSYRKPRASKKKSEDSES